MTAHSALNIFSEYTKSWFAAALGEPTPVQQAAWPAIAKGGHTLVSAPTGTGKTLSAFLVFIDRLKTEARTGSLKKELRLIYISPLKALAGDIRENLHKPLYGIMDEERRAGEADAFPIAVAIRTGDTSAADRRRMIKSPPHILITTPESLYLLLTSLSGQAMLKTAQAIIIDELHAMIDTKRGAHMMLSLARLDRLCGKPLQRIGLSATIEPLSAAAEYLAGRSDRSGRAIPVSIAAPKMKKDVEIAVTSPIENMHILPQGTIWPEIARAVYEHCMGARSVIAFVDGRMYAEKLAYYVNQLAGEGFARTHHGCVSKEQRFEAENDLRSGNLRLLCATSSMELGIDVGDIDRVLQIGYPTSISSVMQRLGRAGHNPGRVSVMHMFPRTAAEGVYCGLTARVASDGGVERTNPPRLCFDVLAQHLVSMATGDGYTIDDVMEMLPRAYPFRDVTRDDVKSILAMLAGDYEHRRDLPVRPRILYDRINERVEGDAYSRMLAVSTGGTIPDKGMFSVRAENGAKLGELDEEFVFEARVGDKFLLGSFAWKIMQMDKDTVTVTQTTPEGARPPFWRHIWLCRRLQTGLAFGRLLREITEAANVSGDYRDGSAEQEIKNTDGIIQKLRELGLDQAAADNAVGFLTRQLDATGLLPDDRTIIAEHFSDEAGDYQLMLHSVFGRQVNAPLAILLQDAAQRATDMDVTGFEDDDGVLLMARSSHPLPQGLIQTIMPGSARPVLTALLPATALFSTTFRYNAARALMMGVRKGKRQPLWVQRLRGAEMLDAIIKYDDHPLIRETKRECLDDYWDMEGLEFVLNGIQTGAIQVRELFRVEPSPMSLPLRRKAEATLLYEYTPTTSGIQLTTEEAMQEMQMIKPAAEQLARLSERPRQPEDEKQLHSLLMIEGDLTAGELPVPLEWFERLAAQKRALYIEPGLWIAAEHADEYEAALSGEINSETDSRDSARLHIIRRALRYRGAQYPEQIAERYFWPDDTALSLLNTLLETGGAVESGGLFYHADLYERARHETISARRKQIKTMPPERYAALLAGKVRVAAPPSEQLQAALRSLSGQPFPPALWESVLLPARVTSYRPGLLDTLLASGEWFWRIDGDSVSFHLYDDIDWDADLPNAPAVPDMAASIATAEEVAPLAEGDEHILYNALQKRGASFITGLSGLINGRPAHEPLLSLAGKGLIHADSFIPVRQWMDRDKIQKSSAKQRVNARVMTLTAGRWDLSRPLAALTVEQQLERAFDKAVIVCRETVQPLGLSWAAALETLRIWEYTGRVRRGYFVEGLSGAQFIHEKEFTRTILSLENPSDEVIWLPASDPMQAWGRCLTHKPDRVFTCVPGTAVGLCAGEPVALFERQGHTLRVFDYEPLSNALRTFVKDFSAHRIFPALKRLTVKQYPKEAAKMLSDAGFTPVMLDYVLYP